MKRDLTKSLAKAVLSKKQSHKNIQSYVNILDIVVASETDNKVTISESIESSKIMSDFDQSAPGQGSLEDIENDTIILKLRQKQRDTNLDLQIQKCVTNKTQPSRSKTPKKRACISSNSLLFDDELLKNNLDASFESVSEESGGSSVR